MKENRTALRPSAAGVAVTMQKVGALLLAAVLCLGLAPVLAWADEGDAFSVALTVVDTTDPANGVLCNAKVDGMTAEDTVADLLAKAGFKAVTDAAQTEHDDKAYADSYGSPVFRGNKSVQDPSGAWTFWATMFNGDSANYADAQLSAKLKANGHYQYVYTSASTFEYSDESASFPVQLTVVDATDPSGTALKNVKVDGMTAEDTVADLLAKAGFTAGDETASKNDATGMTYFVSNNAPYFLGKGYDAVAGTYWSTIFDGGTDPDGWKKAVLDAKLIAHGHYQYVYGTAYTFAYSNAVPQLVSAVVDNPLPVGPAPDPKPEPAPQPTPANAYDASKAAALTANLAQRFSTGGSDASLTNDTMPAALALNALGLGHKIDTAALLANMNGYEAQNGLAMSAGVYAKYILALTAAGLDCRAISLDGSEKNLIEDMESRVSSSSMDVYAAVWILPVYAYGSYEQGASEMSIDDLINFVLANRNAENLFGSPVANSFDTQTTAQAILALLPYRDARADVDAAITAAEQALLSYQNGDGGFGYWSSDRNSNLDATASAVAALTALGRDASEGLATTNGSTPVGYLLAQADADLAGFTSATKNNESMASATILLGLAAAEKLQATGAAFSVFDVQPVSVEKEQSSVVPAGDTEDSSKKQLARTSDGAAPYVAGVTAAALCALAAGVAAARRLRGTRDAALRR